MQSRIPNKKASILSIVGLSLMVTLFLVFTSRAQQKQEVIFTTEQQSFVKKVLAEQKAYNDRANQTVGGAIQQLMELTPDPDTGKPPLDPKKWQTSPTEDGGFKCVRIKEQSSQN